MSGEVGKAFFICVSRISSFLAIRNSLNDRGYMWMYSILPTPNERVSSIAKSKRDPEAMTWK